MSDEYLWNRSGSPDDETVRLERLLGQFRYGRRKPASRRFPQRWLLAAAAALLAGVAAIWALYPAPVTDWHFSNGGRLRVGHWIETAGGIQTKIESTTVGEVKIDTDSRLRLISANGREQHFDLRHGTIHAFIWAPPGRFVVETPSATTVDLGCRYTLQVSQDGAGLITVETGWVAFQFHDLESFIPAGAACVTRPGKGPGTPYFTDSSRKLKTELTKFESTKDPTALAALIAEARDDDALTLWHLLLRTEGAQRAQVFDRSPRSSLCRPALPKKRSCITTPVQSTTRGMR